MGLNWQSVTMEMKFCTICVCNISETCFTMNLKPDSTSGSQPNLNPSEAVQ